MPVLFTRVYACSFWVHKKEQANRMDKGFSDLSVKRQTEASLDGVGIGMGGSQFLGGALDVGTHVLELGGYLLLEGELLEVDGVVGVGRS